MKAGNHYHFIVVGAGAAGLSLVMHMIHSGALSEKRILLIDKSPKAENDRTWCFWEQQRGLFESIVFCKWNKLWFFGNDGSSAAHGIHPYEYKMIRAIDFYNYCFQSIAKHDNISVEYGLVEELKNLSETGSLNINGRTVEADFIFSSVTPDLKFEKNHYFLWQHFKGWFIRSFRPIFTPGEATLMDFRIDQKTDTRFVYVMPFSETEALIEYTVFSKNRLSDDEYDHGLMNYCVNFLSLQQEEFTINSTEFGMIPMTDINFPQSDGRIFYIGTAGGQTKASSGYTFRNIQKHSTAIVHALLTTGTPATNATAVKYKFYDSLLLKILSEENAEGATIFTKLFTNNEMPGIMKFLDNETSAKEDIRLISGLPKTKFINAAISHLLR